MFIVKDLVSLRNRSALAVKCIIIHCLEVSCKEDQITSENWLVSSSLNMLKIESLNVERRDFY